MGRPKKPAFRFNNWMGFNKAIAVVAARNELPATGVCKSCRKKFADKTIDGLRRQLLAHWEQTHRKGAPAPMIPPSTSYNGNYPLADNKDEDIE